MSPPKRSVLQHLFVIKFVKLKQDNECIDDEVKASVAPRLDGAGDVGDVKAIVHCWRGKHINETECFQDNGKCIGPLCKLLSCAQHRIPSLQQKRVPAPRSSYDAKDQGSREWLSINS